MSDATAHSIDDFDRAILNRAQRNFPLSRQPYADLAAELGSDEQTVLTRVCQLKKRGIINRVGGVVRTGRAGASTLAALQVPNDQIDMVSQIVNAFPEVNHNYLREHTINLWFVIVAPSAERLHQVVAEIERQSGLSVLLFPLEKAYHIDLGFAL